MSSFTYFNVDIDPEAFRSEEEHNRVHWDPYAVADSLTDVCQLSHVCVHVVPVSCVNV